MLPQDRDGYAVPWSSDDAVIECEANDSLAGPPEEWPDCPQVDDDVSMIGPALASAPKTSEEPFEPDDADVQDFLDWAERLEYERSFQANAIRPIQ